MAELVEELKQVVDWFHLGLYLEVPEHELKIIDRNYPQDTKRCRTEMLSWWMNNTLWKKWATIVQALEKTGSKVLACNIALKYGTTLLIHPFFSHNYFSLPSLLQISHSQVYLKQVMHQCK